MIDVLYKDCYEKLRIHTLRIVHHDQVADDIVQAAFIYLYEKGLHNNPKFVCLDLLLSYVDSKAINYLRHLKVHAKYKKSILQNETASYEISQVWESVLEQRIKELIPKLSPGQQQVFNMIYFEQMRPKEVAVKLGCAVTTVRVQYALAVNYIIVYFRKRKYLYS